MVVNPKRRFFVHFSSSCDSCYFGNCELSCEEMKKMILVDSYKKPMQKEVPKLDEEMSQILKSDLEESEKIKYYNQILQKYLSLKEKTRLPWLIIEGERRANPSLQKIF